MGESAKAKSPPLQRPLILMGPCAALMTGTLAQRPGSPAAKWCGNQGPLMLLYFIDEVTRCGLPLLYNTCVLLCSIVHVTAPQKRAWRLLCSLCYLFALLFAGCKEWQAVVRISSRRQVAIC